MCQQPPGVFRQGRRRIRYCGCKDIGTAADVRRLRRQQCSVNVSGALLNGTDDDLAARVHIKSDNEVVAGVGWNQGIEVNPSPLSPVISSSNHTFASLQSRFTITRDSGCRFQ